MQYSAVRRRDGLYLVVEGGDTRGDATWRSSAIRQQTEDMRRSSMGLGWILVIHSYFLTVEANCGWVCVCPEGHPRCGAFAATATPASEVYLPPTHLPP